MDVTLTEEDCYCELPTFYENVARKLGAVVTGGTLFDCRKVCVTKGVHDKLWAYYSIEKGYDKLEIASLFLWYGPKANVEDVKEEYLARIDTDGFVK